MRRCTMDEPAEITHLLARWRAGDANAYDVLVHALYDEIRLIAHRAFASEPAGHLLQATALANEALLRVGNADITWQDRSHFLAVVATVMRRFLIDHARNNAREKRGGGAHQITLVTDFADPATSTGVLELHEALAMLAQQDARKAHIMELHYFAGLTYAEIGEVVAISPATVDREIRFSKAWLKSHLSA